MFSKPLLSLRNYSKLQLQLLSSPPSAGFQGVSQGRFEGRVVGGELADPGRLALGEGDQLGQLLGAERLEALGPFLFAFLLPLFAF